MKNNNNRLHKACKLLIQDGQIDSYTLRSNGEFRVNWFESYVKPELVIIDIPLLDNTVYESAFTPNSRELRVYDHFNIDVKALTHTNNETNYSNPEYVDNIIICQFDTRKLIQISEFTARTNQAEEQAVIQEWIDHRDNMDRIELKARSYKKPNNVSIIAEEF